jgi:hypothetical protein
MKRHELKIGYVPLNPDLITAPGDYRRFVRYARIRGISYEIARSDKVYDVVVITQGADITLWKDYKHGLIIYDLIDSYLSISRTNFKALLRGIAKYIIGQHKKLEFSYWGTIRSMCTRANFVICSTQEQKTNISPYCSNTSIVLDYFDNTVRNPKKNYQLGPVVKLIWEGMPSNLFQLKLLKNTLLLLNKKYNIELHVATNLLYYQFLGKYRLSSAKRDVRKIFKNSIVHEWDLETIANLVRQCDIAIIPIDGDYSLTKSKPENKMLFFWKMGLPVVASNIPSYIRAMNGANLNFTCKDEFDWFEKIESLILSTSLRKNSAISGKKYADKFFGNEEITQAWDDVFISAGVVTDLN